MLHIKYKEHQSVGSRDEAIKVFLPGLACDLGGWNILGMKVALYEIWLSLAQ